MKTEASRNLADCAAAALYRLAHDVTFSVGTEADVCTVAESRRMTAGALGRLATKLPAGSSDARRAAQQVRACVNVPPMDAREWARGWRAYCDE